jgi:DNA polymerase III subunit delta
VAKAKKDTQAHYSEIVKDIQANKFAKIYALDGEEPYYIDKISDLLEEKVLQPHEKDFNLTIFYGKDTTALEVQNACNRYPMFADKQLIILKEAQSMKGIEALEPYINNPMPSTILVVCYKYKKFDGRSKMIKSIDKHGLCFTSEVVRDYQMSKWLSSYLSSKKIQASEQVLELLITYLGTDLQKVVNEIDKVLINLPSDKIITPELVEKYVGISREYNVFELPAAILKGNIQQAFRIVQYFEANPKDAPMVLVLGSFYNSFQKLYQYHYLSNQPDSAIAAALKINPFLVKDYKAYARSFSLTRTEAILKILYTYNQASLGALPVATNTDGVLIKELCAKIVFG